jgi:NAD+ kinase
MHQTIRTCALIGKFQDPRVAECTQPLIAALTERGLAVLALDDGPLAAIPAGVSITAAADLVQRADLIIAIGGDGTLLYAAGLLAEHAGYADLGRVGHAGQVGLEASAADDGPSPAGAGAREVPLLGINRGRLGFLTDVLPQDMLRSVDAVLAGEWQADRRALLQARLFSPEGDEVCHYALNDVVFNRLDTGRMLDFETRIDGRYVNSHGGDGLVVASSTGSTAYALSCGGPIVDPRLSVLVVAPICPHTLSDRPIVVPGTSAVEVRLLGQHESVAQVSCDASVLGELRLGGRLQIAPSDRAITLLHPPGHDFFRLVRSKLHWGLGGLSHER